MNIVVFRLMVSSMVPRFFGIGTVSISLKLNVGRSDKYLYGV